MRMPPAHCTSGSTITAADFVGVAFEHALHVIEHLERVLLPGVVRTAEVAIGRRRREHLHEQGLVQGLVELHVADRQRAQRLAVVAVGERDEAGLSGSAVVAPIVKAHFDRHFHGGGAVVREEAARQTWRRNLHQGLA